MTDDPWLLAGFFGLAGYAIGSTPFGALIASAHGKDLRRSGSGNVGATNVGRVVGRGWGYLCFALDAAKGLAPSLVAGAVLNAWDGTPTAPEQAAWLAAGCGTILGHVFSFWLRFRGGKGVATSLGVVLGVYPYFTFVGLVALGLWVAVTLIGRMVSLGSIVAAVAFVPLFAGLGWLLQWDLAALWPLMIFAGAMAGLILFRHRANIRRLLAGTENRIGRARNQG